MQMQVSSALLVARKRIKCLILSKKKKKKDDCFGRSEYGNFLSFMVGEEEEDFCPRKIFGEEEEF